MIVLMSVSMIFWIVIVMKWVLLNGIFIVMFGGNIFDSLVSCVWIVFEVLSVLLCGLSWMLMVVVGWLFSCE